MKNELALWIFQTQSHPYKHLKLYVLLLFTIDEKYQSNVTKNNTGSDTMIHYVASFKVFTLFGDCNSKTLTFVFDNSIPMSIL